MLVIKADTPEKMRSEIVEYLRLRAIQMGIYAHPNMKATKTRKRLSEAEDRALRQVADELEKAQIER